MFDISEWLYAAVCHRLTVGFFSFTFHHNLLTLCFEQFLTKSHELTKNMHVEAFQNISISPWDFGAYDVL